MLRNNLSSEQAEEAGRGFPLGYSIVSAIFLAGTLYCLLIAIVKHLAGWDASSVPSPHLKLKLG